MAFVSDVAKRIPGRDAIEQVYGTKVDFGQIMKTYEHDHSQHPEHKYSAPKFVAVDKRAVMGSPDMDLVSTSYIERLNATTRLHMRRLTRLTLAFSKKLECNATAASKFSSVERGFWSIGDLVEAAS